MIFITYLFGLFGVHRFIIGDKKNGFLMLITFGGLGIWWIIDIIRMIMGHFNDRNGNPINHKSLQLIV